MALHFFPIKKEKPRKTSASTLDKLPTSTKNIASNERRGFQPSRHVLSQFESIVFLEGGTRERGIIYPGSSWQELSVRRRNRNDILLRTIALWNLASMVSYSKVLTVRQMHNTYLFFESSGVAVKESWAKALLQSEQFGIQNVCHERLRRFFLFSNAFQERGYSRCVTHPSQGLPYSQIYVAHPNERS